MAENSSPNQASQVNPPIDIMSAFTNEPPEIDFIWPGFVAGARLLVLDTISRMHNLDENSNGDMARLVSTLDVNRH